MPELPEVETVRKGLETYLVGHSINLVTTNRDNLRFPFPLNFTARLEGKSVLEIKRRAKYLLIRLSDQMTLLGHLGMTGSFHFVRQDLYAPKSHDHVLFYLSNGSVMVYNDPRRFGILDLLPTDAEEEHRLLRHLGPEPLSTEWDANALSEAVALKNSPIKTVLLDQRVVVGVGNIYACEALHMANISPRRKAKTLAGKQGPTRRSQNLVTAVKSVLATAITAGGSTLKDFQDVEGNAGYFAHQFQVYGREGQPCLQPHCSGTIQRISQSGRSTFFCPTCQR